MKKPIVLITLASALVACGGDPATDSSSSAVSSSSQPTSSVSSILSSSSSVTDTSSSAPAVVVEELKIEENEAGFCFANGDTSESKNAGFSGSGYVNSDNTEGAKIRWRVNAASAGSYAVELRFANGGDSARQSELRVNDGEDGSHSLQFDLTGDWANWSTATKTIELSEGLNTLDLISNSADGLANIDSITITGDKPTAGSCTTTGELPELTELKAFPTAEGYGRYATGGRGGIVVHVTNLNDSGPGSLREAIDTQEPRTIVFDVSGVIELQSKLIISGGKNNSYVTVAGHTAPGKGIVLKGWTFGMIGGTDVIVRFIRTRIGSYSGETMDGMGMASAENSIFDHISVSWTIDEAFSSRGANDITLQRSLISEALNEAGHAKYAAGTQHGYCASISGETGSFHHNLLAHCAGRNWSLAGGLYKQPVEYAGKMDIRNNVVYNWRNRTTDGGAHEVNFVNNYYKPGPASELFYALTAENDGFPGTQRYYFVGNVMEGRWDENNQNAGRREAGEPRSYNPWVSQPFFESFVTTQSAGEAYYDVLADVGANKPMLDDHDKRIINEVRNGTFTYRGSKTGYPGLIDNQEDVGGLEDYPVITRDANWDTDRDGMPNAWEIAHNLDPNNPADGNYTTLSNVGYTNLEMYLAELAGDFD